MLKKWLRRIAISSSASIIALLCIALIVLATPGLVTKLVGVVTDTTISLYWVSASGSTSTVIRQSTTAFPTAVNEGTSTYNGTGTYIKVEDLSPGTTYYFSAWGYDGADYSDNATQLALTTYSEITGNTTVGLSEPTLPANVAQDPDTSGWDIDPIDDIFSWFADPSGVRGGLGMPTDNLIMFLVGLGITMVGLVTYVKWRSFGTSWVIVLMLSCFFSTVGVMQWIVVGFLILAGAGVWAVEHSTQ